MNSQIPDEGGPSLGRSGESASATRLRDRKTIWDDVGDGICPPYAEGGVAPIRSSLHITVLHGENRSSDEKRGGLRFRQDPGHSCVGRLRLGQDRHPLGRAGPVENRTWFRLVLSRSTSRTGQEVWGPLYQTEKTKCAVLMGGPRTKSCRAANCPWKFAPGDSTLADFIRAPCGYVTSQGTEIGRVMSRVGRGQILGRTLAKASPLRGARRGPSTERSRGVTSSPSCGKGNPAPPRDAQGRDVLGKSRGADAPTKALPGAPPAGLPARDKKKALEQLFGDPLLNVPEVPLGSLSAVFPP